MAMVNVVTTAAYIGGSIGSGLLAWSKDWRPPGAACYIRQMNRVNSCSGSALLRCYTINIVVPIIIIIIIIIMATLLKMVVYSMHCGSAKLHLD